MFECLLLRLLLLLYVCQLLDLALSYSRKKTKKTKSVQAEEAEEEEEKVK